VLDPLSVGVGAAFVAAIVLIAYKRSSRLTQPREGGSFFSACEHEFTVEGITSSQQAARSFRPWQRVAEVTTTAEHVFIWIDTFLAIVIPVRDLPEGMTAEQMVAGCNEWRAASEAQPTVSPSPRPEVVSEPRSAIEQRQSSWRTVFRLLTLRSVEHPGSALSDRPWRIVGLALVYLALWVGLSWFGFDPEPTFYPYGAPALAWYVLAALTVAFTMAKRSHPQVTLSQACFLLATLLAILIIADFAIVTWIPERWVDVAHAIPALYTITYCARGLRAVTGVRQPVAVIGSTAVAVLFLWLANALYVDPAVWITEDRVEYAEDVASDWGVGEPLLFEQSARIDAAVTHIEPANGDAPVGFFVGFAGYGEQQVFAEEIKFAAQKFAQRFDTADRALFLINDRRDRETQPLATVAGLRYALKAIASKMRVDRDVLFLTLSSHGSEDPLIAVENGTLPLNDLSGEALAEALRESGIQWRVIVISACYSGAFIESLRDPNSVVITAASPDRTSFGCSDDRDLTYFGEAFFRDSLPQAASLRDAFDAATELVSEREAKEGFEASKPQAFFGENIEPRLSSMLRPASGISGGAPELR
jgi:hypothetical protein